jgi:pimeloyl-ACP methyl ester carboxylesterase
MDLLTDDAVALIGALGLGSVHFVGLSMGGFVGLRLAARHPELVRSLSLLETAADPEPRENIPKYGRLNIVARLGGLRFVARQVLPIMFGPTFLNDPKRASARETWKNELLRNRRTIYRAVNGVLDRDSVEDLLPTIKAPTLVVHSAEDTAIKRPRMEALAAGIAGSRLELLPRGGHTATIEEPELMNQVLVRFLDGLPS